MKTVGIGGKGGEKWKGVGSIIEDSTVLDHDIEQMTSQKLRTALVQGIWKLDKSMSDEDLPREEWGRVCGEAQGG